MKKIKIFKSGFCEKLKLLLIPIGLLIGSITTQAWAKTIYLAAGAWNKSGAKIKVVAWDTGGNWTYEMSSYAGDIFKADINDAYTNCRFERWSGDGKDQWGYTNDMVIGDYNRCLITGTYSGEWYEAYWDQMMTVRGGTIFFDNSLMAWEPSNQIQFFHGDDGFTYTFVENMTHIDNTKLWYCNLSAGSSAANYLRFADASYGSGGFKSDNKPDLRTDAYRGKYGFDSEQLYLFTTSGGDNDASITPTWMEVYSHFNKTLTLAAKVKSFGSSEYVEGESKGALNGSSFTFSNYNTCGTTSGATPVVASGETSASFAVGYTATTTISVTDVDPGYTFKGWYKADGTQLSTSSTYDEFLPKEDAVIYAYFEEKNFSVTFTTDGHGTITAPASSPKTVGQVTGLSINATPSLGYCFDKWTVTSGTANFDNASSASTKVYPSEDATIQANFTPKWYLKGDFNSWNEGNPLTLTSATSGSANLTTASDNLSDQKFKIWDKENNVYYTIASKSVTRANPTPSGEWTAGGTSNDMKFNSDLIDTYIFNVTFTSNIPSGLSVTYPTPEYTISYKDQGNETFTGTQTSAPTTHTYGTPTTLKIPTKEGYNFAGWWTDAACTETLVGTTSAATLAADGYTDNITLYAKWTDTHLYYYKGASPNEWSTAANWTRNAVPGSTDDVIVLTALNAPSGTTTVNSIRIATSGTYTPVGGSGITANGSLTIPSGAALKVVTNVANCTISANAPTSGTSTTSSTLNIGYGGALVWGTAGTPGDATVGFHTPSGGVAGSQDAVNDYIGIPFTSLSSDAYYNAWVFAVSGDTWAEISGATLSPWTGYNIIEKKEKGESAGGSYSLTGTLVANNATVSGGATAGTETLYANSWVAPIEISKMSITGTATVYLFRPTSFNDIEDAADPLGNYDTYPVNSSSGVYIPSMKSFSVVSSTASVNYATAVYGEVSGAFSAPRRERKADYRQAIWDTQDSLFVTVKSASGWGDVLKMFIHEDFSQDYENGWDGPKMEGMWEAPKLYTLNNEGQMAVSCVPNADNSVIAFHAGTASNEYTFTFKYSGEEALVLKDTKTGVETPIEDGGTYEFTSNTSDDDLRFVIKKVTNAATGVDEIGGNASGVQKIMHNGTMYILREGRIYSAEGAFVK